MEKNNKNDTNNECNKYLDRISDILGLSIAERKIICSINMPRSMSSISRITKIPQKSLPYTLLKLENRGLVKKYDTGHKKTIWKTDLQKAVRELAHLIYYI